MKRALGEFLDVLACMIGPAMIAVSGLYLITSAWSWFYFGLALFGAGLAARLGRTALALPARTHDVRHLHSHEVVHIHKEQTHVHAQSHEHSCAHTHKHEMAVVRHSHAHEHAHDEIATRVALHVEGASLANHSETATMTDEPEPCEDNGEVQKMSPGSEGSTNTEDDLISALMNLGYKKGDAAQVARRVIGQRPDAPIEELMRSALALRGKRDSQ